MNLITLILNIVLLSTPVEKGTTINTTKNSLDRNLETSLYSKQTTDTMKLKTDNFQFVIKGTANYDIVVTTIQKEDYEAAKQIKTPQLLDKTIMPPQVNVTEACYTVTTANKTIKNCLEADEQLISISYLGYIKKLNSCVIDENWFESTSSNLIINLEDGSTSYISGNELIFSPNLKFIYSYANDGIDFEGISLHQLTNKKAQPILVTGYEVEEKYNFDFSSFGKAYWVSDHSFYASNGSEYYKFEIQDKRITYRSEFKKTIVNSANSKFTIKIDELKDGTIRYTSWNKPITTNDIPSLVLYNGDIEQQNKYGSGFDYKFQNGEYLYIIENNIETTNSKRVMLRLYKNNEEILYTSLKDLTKLKTKK